MNECDEKLTANPIVAHNQNWFIYYLFSDDDRQPLWQGDFEGCVCECVLIYE